MSRFIGDLSRLGYLPLQHFEGDVEADHRVGLYACRIKTRNEHLEHQIDGEGEGPAKDTRGDVVGAMLWPVAKSSSPQQPSSNFVSATSNFQSTVGHQRAAGARPIPAWGFGFPCVVTRSTYRDRGRATLARDLRPTKAPTAQALPTRSVFNVPNELSGAFAFLTSGDIATREHLADERLEAKDIGLPDWASPVLRGWTGITRAGTEETAQHETFHPDALGLVASGAIEFDGLSSRVFPAHRGELGKAGWAPLDTILRVVPNLVRDPRTPINDERKFATARARQEVPSMLALAGGMPFVGHDGGLGWLSNVVTRGVGVLGEGDCRKHRYGLTSTAGHLRANAAIFASPEFDGPWDLTIEGTIPEASQSGSIPQRVIFGFDPNKVPELGAPGPVPPPGGAQPGVWTGIVWSPTYVDDPPDDPNDPTPPGGGDGDGDGNGDGGFPPGGGGTPEGGGGPIGPQPPPLPPADPTGPVIPGTVDPPIPGVPNNPGPFAPDPAPRLGPVDPLELGGTDLVSPIPGGPRPGLVLTDPFGGDLTPGFTSDPDAPEGHTHTNFNPTRPRRVAGTLHDFHLPGFTLRAACRVTDADPSRNDLRYRHRPTPAEIARGRELPPVLRFEAIGFEDPSKSDGWGYNRHHDCRRYQASESVPGVGMFLPPELGAEHHRNDWTLDCGDPSTVYVCALTDYVYWATGKPDPLTGGIKSGWRWGQDSSNSDRLRYESIDSNGAATPALDLYSDKVDLFASGNLSARVTSTLTTVDQALAVRLAIPSGNIVAAMDAGGVELISSGRIVFYDGLDISSAAKRTEIYSSATKQVIWRDVPSSDLLLHDWSAVSAIRTVTWQDKDQTVACLSDIAAVDLDDLADVTIASVGDNEVLAYDLGSGEWINQTASEAGLQPFSDNLDVISGLAPTADNFIAGNAGGTLSLIHI